jgi:DNA-binding HxlR family transcriptional regulator
MDTEKFSSGPCPLARALTRMGDAWSMMILRDAGAGATRFDQFRAGLGIAPNILTRRLAGLVDHGLLEKRRYSQHPPRDEYLLTPAGRSLLPVLLALGEWGRHHCGQDAMSYPVDGESGARVEPLVVDGLSGRPLSAIAVKMVVPGTAA